MMTAVRDQIQVQTLGEWIVSLRPGDACVCCGNKIEGSETLVCPRCGCEVGPLERPVWAVERALDPAA